MTTVIKSVIKGINQKNMCEYRYSTMCQEIVNFNEIYTDVINQVKLVQISETLKRIVKDAF